MPNGSKWPNGTLADFSLQSLVNLHQLYNMGCNARSSLQLHINRYFILDVRFISCCTVESSNAFAWHKVSLLQNPCLLQGFTWNESASSPIFDQSCLYVYYRLLNYYFSTPRMYLSFWDTRATLQKRCHYDLHKSIQLIFHVTMSLWYCYQSWIMSLRSSPCSVWFMPVAFFNVP